MISQGERSRAGGRNRQAGRRRKVVYPSREPENPASVKIGPIAAVLDGERIEESKRIGRRISLHGRG